MDDDKDSGTRRLRVAAVDDDRMLLRAERRSLSGSTLACDFLAFESGEELLEHADDGFDLVVMDIFLHGLSGLDVCRRLRLLEGTRSTPVVLVSCDLTMSLALAAMDAGASRTLAKPYFLRSILETYSELANHHRGDSSDRSWMIMDHVGLSHSLAERLARRFRPLLAIDDAEALAFVGLCSAAEEALSSDESFAVRATRRIRALVLSGVHPLLEHDAAHLERLRDLAAMQWRLVCAGRDPTVENMQAVG